MPSVDINELVRLIMCNSRKVVVGGRTYYVVEQDRLVDRDQLMQYAADIAGIANGVVKQAGGAERLVVATEPDGRKMRWMPPAKLTWSMDDDSFRDYPEWKSQAEELCTKATEDWNDAAEEHHVEDKISFARASKNKTPLFKVAYNDFADIPGMLASAFFPNDLEEKRFVLIGPNSFLPNLPYNRVGILRHELGHILGFRHEHIRPEAQAGMSPEEKQDMEQWVTGGIGGKELTKYDTQSVMHYPLNGHGTLEFELSTLDKEGLRDLYSAPANPKEIKEYPVPKSK